MKPERTPPWPTTMKSRLSDGRLQGTDNSVWLYRVVPMGPVTDAKSPMDGFAVAETLLSAYDELASMTPINSQRRSVSKANYRQTHLLLVNVPKLFEPPAGHPLGDYLREAFPNVETDRRLLLFGVRLKDKLGTGGFKSTLEGVVQTLVEGALPLTAYDADYAKVDAALTRSGLTTPSADDLRLANAWWNHGDAPDTPMLPHGDHMHVFTTTGAIDEVRKTEEVGDCTAWRDVIEGQHSLSFAAVQDFDLEFVDPTLPEAHWASAMLDQGALVISIRGDVEPASVTRAELRRQRKRFIDDINERVKNGKMERQEQTDQEMLLGQVEGMYSGAGGSKGTPTLTNCSVIVGFNGQIADISQHAAHSAAKLNLMQYRQPAAMAETWLCSPLRANPYLHDLPTQTVACSGIQSLNSVGDITGAAVGFTERDRQIAWLSPTAASDADTLPVALVAGATGSGKTLFMLNLASQYARMGKSVIIVDPKALSLDTMIPTPNGWKANGDIKVGDQVFDRHGKPCNVVALSPVFEQPDMYEVHLADHQVIKADAHHRWVVADSRGRSTIKNGPARAGYVEQLVADQQALLDLIRSTTDADVCTKKSLLALIDLGGVSRWKNVPALRDALNGAGVGPMDTSSKSHTYSTAVALKGLLSSIEARMEKGGARTLRDMTTIELLEAGLYTSKSKHQYQFAIPKPEAFQAPEAELPIHPYLLGAWLGDGKTKSNAICSGSALLADMLDNIREAWGGPVELQGQFSEIVCQRDFSRCLYGHDDYVIVNHGDRSQSRCATCEKEHHVALRKGEKRTAPEMTNPTMTDLLRQAGVFRNKHIPENYRFASIEQRMELLRGLMDTDGTVKKSGQLRLTLSCKPLADDATELIRGLGYIVTVSETKPVCVTRDPDGNKIRKQGKTAWVIQFQGGPECFKLPQKAGIAQTEIHSSNSWNAIRKIVPIASEPARCIRVDSEDHTYLAGQFVPTHNTGSDHSAAVMAVGGQVASLDDIASSDGVFDPLRFSHSQSAGIELAASMLMSVNPWGSAAGDFETRLTKALHYGVTNGAKCILQALNMAKDAGLVGHDLVGPVEDLASSSAMFAAVAGRDPHTQGLSVAKGITLIKVGQAHLNLPAPGQLPDSQNQRVALALVRMMVFGSAMALTGQGGGVLCLDEAWTILSGEGGRAEVERLGRLARSQQVLPILFTQRVSDAIEAGLSGYISRGLILPIEDAYEAHAACELFKLEATPERISRITAKATMGSVAGGVAPNWNSMRALVDPTTRQVIRGSVAIYADLAGRAVPVEIVIPPEMIRLASTNPEDIRRRQAQEAMAAGRLDATPQEAPVMVEERPVQIQPEPEPEPHVEDDWFADLPPAPVEVAAAPQPGFDADGWPI